MAKIKEELDPKWTNKCLNCRKLISYDVLGSQFCVECDVMFRDKIREINRLRFIFKIWGKNNG
ncbi:hypothetical protein LCGC14_0531190 [marine sediment metagenome]|uniref:Uncharacterized protein n=1 Tax=marine sediment metagenome TaxID=412755 RepID=A0A0F9V3K3_9ZZZZ